MTGIIHGLNWLPAVPDKFITWGAEVNLYKIGSSDAKQVCFSAHSKEISSKSSALFLASETRYQYIRCLKPSFDNEVLVAVGLANGGVSLCSFDQTNEISTDFTPRQQRPCLCLAWNEVEKNLLALGHDKNRSDYCITVWNTERGASKESSNLIGLSETAHSLCWDKNHKILIAGISQKNVKFFDLRQNITNCTTVTSRMVHGLCVCPNNRYLASYVDSMVGIWDLRNLEKPLSQMQTLKNVTNLTWCPTRATYLSTIQRDSPFLQLIDVHSADIDGSCDIFCTKRLIAPFQTKEHSSQKNCSVVDMSWHYTDFERALILSETGAINDFRIPELAAVTWDTNNSLWKSSGPNICGIGTNNFTENNILWEFTANESFTEDVTQVIHKRAVNDYGLLSDIKKNGDLSQSNNLKSLWIVLANMIREDRMLGIKEVLDVNNTTDVIQIIQSEMMVISWPEFICSNHPLLVYRSESRELAQVLCGWTFENEMDTFVNKFIPDLCSKKEFSRAAMICVFHLKIKQAIEILSKAADQASDPSILRMAAITLSGFNADRCNALLRNYRGYLQIHDPHLKATFAFLTSINENYESVIVAFLKTPKSSYCTFCYQPKDITVCSRVEKILQFSSGPSTQCLMLRKYRSDYRKFGSVMFRMERGLSLGDRLAFACKYLSDSKLAEYVKSIIQTSIESADLHGLLLTGGSTDGINLLQSYLDLSDDVQTVALISIRFFHREVFSEYRVQCWISSYLDLLDTWSLWEKRAELEIKMESICTPKSTRSVFLLCNFCGKSVSAALQEETRIRNASSNLNKLSSCPNCRKPLPRCSLCLLHMGTTTSNFLQGSPGQDSLGWQSKPFAKWFSWCQTCRHGGHTEHLMQWFSQNSECPVTGCNCKCLAVDLAVLKILRDTS